MPRIELTIKAAYLPGWGVLEAVREILQNARDAEVQDGAKMTVEHVYRTRDRQPVGALVICNEGTTISRNAFLIGHTTKEGRTDLIGRYGEGLKFGVLAALRQGLQVKIRNGSETWTPLIVRSEKFDAEVLAFDVSTGHKSENRVQIEILGIDLNTWEKMKEKFLFLNPPQPENVIRGYHGSVLMEAALRGMIFVKGIYCCKDENLSFGYDVKEADIDRDRRMINDQHGVTSSILADVCGNPRITDRLYELLHMNASEVNCISTYSLNQVAREAIVEKFTAQYGDAIAVETEDEATQLAHFGKRGVKLPYGLRGVIQDARGLARDILKGCRLGALRVWTLDELETAETAAFETARDALVGALRSTSRELAIAERIKVVDFGDPKILGTFNPEDDSIRVARSCLSSAATVLRVLIHEAAHVSGKDGTKEHEASIGDLTEAVFARLLA